MSRPNYRQPPRLRHDRYNLAYDFSTRMGWGTYPIRGERSERSSLVWEEDDRAGNSHPMMGRLSDESLVNLVTVGRNLGME